MSIISRYSFLYIGLAKSNVTERFCCQHVRHNADQHHYTFLIYSYMSRQQNVKGNHTFRVLVLYTCFLLEQVVPSEPRDATTNQETL